MSDQIHHDHLTSLETRRECFQLVQGIGETFLNNHVERDEVAVMAALANLFVAAAEFMEVDPEAAFSQLVQAIEAGDLSIHDDKAQGRFVFPERETIN